MSKFLQLFLLSLLISISSNSLANDDKNYGEKVGEKALNGLTNMTTSFLEIPKNIINATNDSNIVYGTVGGTAKGIINMLGRSLIGLIDFVTAPLPTKPIVSPVLIWDDFDADTTYGESFRLDED